VGKLVLSGLFSGRVCWRGLSTLQLTQPLPKLIHMISLSEFLVKASCVWYPVLWKESQRLIAVEITILVMER
jgi:hypothetical protein